MGKKRVFNFNDYADTDNVYMHLPDTTSRIFFGNVLNEAGRKWSTGESYVNQSLEDMCRGFCDDDNMAEYGPGSGFCSFFNDGTWATIKQIRKYYSFADSHVATGLEFYDFDWSAYDWHDETPYEETLEMKNFLDDMITGTHDAYVG